MDLLRFLPTTVKELELRGWQPGDLDVILFTGDAYVDHPAFGAAVIGRVLEAEGLRVAIVPQPNWRDDLRDFRKMGRPRLFFGVTAGAMDSMVNKYTAARRLRSEDAYTPDGRHDQRPEYPSIVYTQLLKKLYPDVPVVLGGIEASMRRLTHYDYWQERLRPSILIESGADILVWGMGEQPIVEIAHRLQRGEPLDDVPQTAHLEACERLNTKDESAPMEPTKANRPFGATKYEKRIGTLCLRKTKNSSGNAAIGSAQRGSYFVVSAANDSSLVLDGEQSEPFFLFSHQQCLADKRAQAANCRTIEEESNSLQPRRLVQEVDDRIIVVNPQYPPMTTEQLDHCYDLPYTRLPHPRYKDKRIPAYEMIRHSVTIHRGCFGGCAFCTISAHQGKQIVSRSQESILREVRAVTQMPDFKGYLSDLGGPSANMYRMSGRDRTLCERCRRPSCLHPTACRNLDTDHRPLLDLYRAVDAVPGIKKSFIGSGIRYDLLLLPGADKEAYTRELITRHVSGRLKVAPEHTSDAVLQVMRKPPFSQFETFKRHFDCICREAGLHQQLIPYFISSHPGCTEEDMAELAVITRRLNFHLEQVQDFTPTPMTVSTEAWYTGLHPYTLRPLYSARTPQQKAAQRQFFFWYQPDQRRALIAALRRVGRTDLIDKLFG